MLVTFTRHAILRMRAAALRERRSTAFWRAVTSLSAIPTTSPYPSVLMLGGSEARPIHVVAAHNMAEDEIIIITVYRPDPERWDPEFRVRRRRTS